MILIDFSQFARACFFTSQLESDSDVGLMKHIIMTSIKNVNVKHRDFYGRLVICCDGRNYWRRDFFPHYKGKRREQRKAKSEYEKKIEEIFFRAKDELQEELGDNSPWYVIRIPTLEADDVIALLSQTEGRHLVVSSDHDLKQLQLNENVQQLCPRYWKNITAEDPVWYRFSHIIKGDTGDGIPNILSDDDTLMTEGKRQRPIKKKMIEEAWEHFKISRGSLFQYLERLSPLARQNFIRNETLIDLLYITDTDVTSDYKQKINEQMKQQKDSYTGASKLMKYLASNKMNKLLDQINDFSTNNPGALI